MKRTKTILTIDGLRVTVVGSEKHQTAILSRRADVACGLHRPDFGECSGREVARFDSILRACREYAKAAGVSSVEVVTSDGVVLEAL